MIYEVLKTFNYDDYKDKFLWRYFDIHKFLDFVIHKEFFFKIG